MPKMKVPEGWTGLEWFAANQEEYAALTRAEDGDPSKLAAFITENGELRTAEARKFVHDRLMGVKRKRGNKATIGNEVSGLLQLAEIRRIAQNRGITENAAMNIYLERNPDLKTDTVKTQLRRTKMLLKGRGISAESFRFTKS